MNQRQVDILIRLKEKDESTVKLAQAFEVTPRTIRNDIKDINICLENYGGIIERAKSRKFKLNILDEDKFDKFLNKYIKSKKFYLQEPNNRVIYIALKYLFSNDYIKLDDFLDELYISKSTLQNDFKITKSLLEKYKIKIDFKPNYGGKIVGKERDIRNAISNILYELSTNQCISEIKTRNLLFDEDKIDRIYRIVLDNIIVSNIKLSDMSLNNLVVHIAIALRRIEQNQYINKIFELDLSSNYEYKIALKIISDIENEFKIKFPKEEIYYITMHLLGTKLVQKNTKEIKVSSEDEYIKDIALKIIRYAEQKTTYKLTDDKELLYSIILHLKPAIYRYKNNMNIRNPLLSSVKINYPEVFLIAKESSKILEKDLNIKFNEDEIGYLAIHLGTAIERCRLDNKPIRTIVVCTTGVGSSQLLKYKLESRFSNQLDIIKTVEFYRLEEVLDNSIDLIISTVHLPNFDKIPYIMIRDILGDSNFNEIEDFINKRNIKINKKFLEKEDIYIDLDFNTKEESIKYLCDKLVEKNKAPRELYNSIMEREKIASTSFGNFVAMPHPMELLTNETFWTLGILKNGILWDDKIVKLIIVLNIAKKDVDNLKDMYNILLEIIDNKEIVQKIVKSKSVDEIYKIMNNMSR